MVSVFMCLPKKINRSYPQALKLLLLSATLFLFFIHMKTIGYPYFTEDEATYRMFGLLGHTKVEAGIIWKFWISHTLWLDETSYRYCAALSLFVICSAIIFISTRIHAYKSGLLAVILLMVSPISFYVLHSTRPEPFHAAMAMCVVAICTLHILSKNKSIWLLCCAVLLTLLLPYTHIFGIVHLPVTSILILVAIAVVPYSLFTRVALITVLSMIELAVVFHFSSNTLPVKGQHLSAGILENAFNVLSIIYMEPSYLIRYDPLDMDGHHINFLFYTYKQGRFLREATGLLWLFGILGAAVTLIRGVAIKTADMRLYLSSAILAFFITFFAILYKIGYMNVAYIAAALPWCAIGCGLGMLTLVDYCKASQKKHFGIKLFSISAMTLSALILSGIVFYGAGEIYVFSWPLRHAAFSDTVKNIKTALLKNNCVDVPYISAPYQGFIGMQPGASKMRFAPDFIVTYTTHLRYLMGVAPIGNPFYGATMNRLNQPGACIVASEEQLFTLGHYAGYAELRAPSFFSDNFSIIEAVKAPFYYHDTFGNTMLEPVVKHGGTEKVYILKAKKTLTKKLINQYS